MVDVLYSSVLFTIQLVFWSSTLHASRTALTRRCILSVVHVSPVMVHVRKVSHRCLGSVILWSRLTGIYPSEPIPDSSLVSNAVNPNNRIIKGETGIRDRREPFDWLQCNSIIVILFYSCRKSDWILVSVQNYNRSELLLFKNRIVLQHGPKSHVAAPYLSKRSTCAG